jgi:two-component system nitrogen regulation response regulator GlnG
MMSSILIIDDEDKYLELCRRHLSEHEFVGPARNHREAAAVLNGDAPVDLVLLDVHFDIPEDDLLPVDKTGLIGSSNRERAVERIRRSQGLLILDALRREHPDTPVIVMTSRDDLPIEADATRLNAENYTYLLDDEYLDARSLRAQVDGILADRASVVDEGPFFWGRTKAMEKIRSRVGIIARGQLPIIIQGSTGTGKSLLAREVIHPGSRRTGPFVAVDLSTIPTDLMAAHLFGVVKGAYTGAVATREGVLARAHGGTLFLDEIGNLGLDVQKSLLMVLQEGRFRPVGSADERTVDVKLVVATNEDLPRRVREGHFREDLYMRLNPATSITLPTLRERADDFRQLLEFFMRRVANEGYNRDLVEQYARQRELGVPDADGVVRIGVGSKLPTRADPRRIYFLIHPSSFKLLRGYDWPGSFRQFEMVLSNLVTFTLVDLVDHAEQVEPASNSEVASRADVVPVLPRAVAELLRPLDLDHDPAQSRDPDDPVTVELHAHDSLNALSQDVERQYLAALYRRTNGDLREVSERLLGDPDKGRKIQLRMNQLGLRLRELKRG